MNMLPRITVQPISNKHWRVLLDDKPSNLVIRPALAVGAGFEIALVDAPGSVYMGIYTGLVAAIDGASKILGVSV